MSRQPVRDINGRQYGETVRNARAHYLTGETLGMISYVGSSNHEVMRAFARDIEKGHYQGRIVYSMNTCLDTETEETQMFVIFGEYADYPYMWGQG